MGEVRPAEQDDAVTQAIKIAKTYVRKLYSDEGIDHLGLEEVDHTHDQLWRITLGFTRPWDGRQAGSPDAVRRMLPDGRTYKVVSVDLAQKRATGISNRFVAIDE